MWINVFYDIFKLIFNIALKYNWLLKQKQS